MKRSSGCKCGHCKELFIPDRRNVGRQRFCAKEECKRASKAKSQRRWLAKSENQNHFRGPENTERVRQWRKANPGYWRSKKPLRPEPLQDPCMSQDVPPQKVVVPEFILPLQDLFQDQSAAFVGFIATMTGFALQEDIAPFLRSMVARGHDILSGQSARCADGLSSDSSTKMKPKPLLRPDRLRHVPRQFSWIDQRFVRHRHIARCRPPALALYLFLVIVADEQGMSYYSDAKTAQLLSMSWEELKGARGELIQAGLIAFTAPYYQVLSLDYLASGSQNAPAPTMPEPDAIRTMQTLSMSEALRKIFETKDV